MIESVLGAEAGKAAAEARLPSAAHVWWRAERRAREQAVRRATLPIVMLEKVALAVGTGTAVLLLWRGSWLERWLATLESILGMLPLAGQNASLALIGGGSLLLLVLFALYLDWVEG